MITFLLEFSDHRCLVTVCILKHFWELQERVKSHIKIISWYLFNPFSTSYNVSYLFTYHVYNALGRCIEYLWACVSHFWFKRLLNLKLTWKWLSCEKMRTEQKTKMRFVAASFICLESFLPCSQTPSCSKVSALHLHTAFTHVLRGGHRMLSQAEREARGHMHWCLFFQMGCEIWIQHWWLMVHSSSWWHLNICSSFHQVFDFCSFVLVLQIKQQLPQK